MADRRIPTKTTELLDLLLKIAAGIQGEPNYPASAPTQNEIQGEWSFLNSDYLQLVASKNLTKVIEERIRDRKENIFEKVTSVDLATDLLYGRDGAQKNNFGLPPKKIGGPAIPLDRCVITKITDGRGGASLFVDWDNVPGAISYQVEWYLDPDFTQPAGHATATQSQFHIAGLTPTVKYWIRVRAVRGNDVGLWSDPATRIPNA